jgi:hypothetical protein
MADKASTTAPLTRKEIEAKIVALAWQDDAFRHKFVADPKGQFEERLRTKMPTGLKMSVHEEDQNNLHFVIPMKPNAKPGELSDEDLEKVAGGTSPTIFLSITIASQAITIAAVESGTKW